MKKYKIHRILVILSFAFMYIALYMICNYTQVSKLVGFVGFCIVFIIILIMICIFQSINHD